MPLRYIAGLLLLGAIWGGSFLLIKLSVVDIPPATLVAMRLILASLLLLGVLKLQRLRLPTDQAIWRHLWVIGVIGVVGPFLLITWGQKAIPSSMTAILNATAPLFTVLLAFVSVREERLVGTRLLGVLLGFAGVLVAVGIEEFRFSSTTSLSQLAVLGAAFGYAVTALYIRRNLRTTPPLILATGQILTGTLVMVPIALLNDGLPQQVPSLTAIVALLILTVLGTVFAYLLYYWLFDGLGATRTSMVGYIIPPIALIYGSLILNELITINKIVGLVLVFLGIGLANGMIQSLLQRRKPA
jgi:drug/metabolite transporter (DMT)-like permease